METIEKTINKYLCDGCLNKYEKCICLEIIEYKDVTSYKCLNYEHLSTIDVE